MKPSPSPKPGKKTRKRAKRPQTYRYKMSEGQKLGRNPNNPHLFVIGDGKLTYLWVGNDAPDDMACFATIAGEANLRRIAHAILTQLES